MAQSCEEIARKYAEYDPNVETKKEVQEMLDRKDTQLIDKLFGSRLAFGTAGLRGPMGVGYNRMNDLVILQVDE